MHPLDQDAAYSPEGRANQIMNVFKAITNRARAAGTVETHQETLKCREDRAGRPFCQMHVRDGAKVPPVKRMALWYRIEDLRMQ